VNLSAPEHTPRRRLKRTKIVATVGPASDTLDMLRRLADAGVNVFRLNFSHGTHEGHLEVIRAVRQVCVEISRPLAILGDLCGPKLRLLPVLGDRVEVEEGDVVVLTSGSGDGTDSVFGVNIPDFHLATRPGETVPLTTGPSA
jgi:pyruvate kinase